MILKEDERIVSITHKNPFNYQRFTDDKLSVLDIKAETDDGTMLNVEMQVGEQTWYSSRALYYWSKLYSEQLGEGKQYELLKPSVGIHFLNNIVTEGLTEGHTIHRIYDVKKCQPVTDLFEIHYVQMPLIDDIMKSEEVALAEWIMLMKEINNQKSQPMINQLIQSREVMKMALEEYTKVTSESILREQLASQEKFRMDREAEMAYAKRKAIKEGREKGREEGRKEAMKAVAKNMLTEGITLEQIKHITGLNTEEMNAII